MHMKSFSILAIILAFTISCTHGEGEVYKGNNESEGLATIRLKAREAKRFCRGRKLNTDFYIHIDLGRHSGLKRFYIWDFAGDSISHRFLVSHGCCQSSWGRDLTREKAATSNTENSRCSSIGKYVIGDRGFSNWGIHVKYLLHGLEATNSNALRRDIVLHSWEKVSDEEIYPDGTPEGWGCPAVSNEAMRLIDQKLKASGKKVLMWVSQ